VIFDKQGAQALGALVQAASNAGEYKIVHAAISSLQQQHPEEIIQQKVRSLLPPSALFI
jgi:hypothetical protein